MGVNLPPLPQEPLGETFQWRDWLFKLSQNLSTNTGNIFVPSLYYDATGRLLISLLPTWLLQKISVDPNEALLIPNNFQSIFHGQFTVTGQVIVEGQLVIL